MLPSDPRTWTDFQNPSAHGFEKIDCDTTLERAFVSGAMAFGLLAVSIVLTVARATARHRAPVVAASSLPVIVPALLIAAGVSMALRWLTDNFYLVDAEGHAVYYHFEFMFVRSVRLLLEGKDIQFATVETRKRNRRYRSWSYGSWWEHRTVLIDTNGRAVPMSNWQRDGLWSANNFASELSKKLGCEWREAPDETQLVVRMENGRPGVTFEDYTWFAGTRAMDWVVVATFVVVLGLLSAFGWMR